MGVSNTPAKASGFYGALPVGYSDQSFQTSGASTFGININALGPRDPSLCSSCNSGYTDQFTVNFFDLAGNRLGSSTGTNYLYSTQFGGSHGIGALPVWFFVPNGTANVEVISQLSIFGLLGSNTGNLTIFTDGSIAAATPLPGALPLFAGGLGALGLIRWSRKRSRHVAASGRAMSGRILASG